MNNLAFLLLALVVSVVGAAVVIVRNRPPVGRTEIDEFQAVMGALAPDRTPTRRDAAPHGVSDDGEQSPASTGEHEGPSSDAAEGEQ